MASLDAHDGGVRERARTNGCAARRGRRRLGGGGGGRPRAPQATQTIARPAGDGQSTAPNYNKRFVQADYKASTAREPSEPADAPTH